MIHTKIVDGDQTQPEPQTWGWTPRTIAEWAHKDYSGLWSKFIDWLRQMAGDSHIGYHWYKTHGSMSVEERMEYEPYFLSSCAWLHAKGITAPSEPSAEDIALWAAEDEFDYDAGIGKDLLNLSERSFGSWQMTCNGLRDEFYTALRTNPAYLDAVRELLKKHGINITKKEDGAMATGRNTVVKFEHGKIEFDTTTKGLFLRADCNVNSKGYTREQWNKIDRAARIALGEQSAAEPERYEVK